MSKASRALWILSHEGPTSLSKKTARYLKPKKVKGESKLEENYRYLANPIFQITEEEIRASHELNKNAPKNIKSALWFVPYFDHVTYGGIFTIFRFIESLSKRGVKTSIVIYDNRYVDKAKMQAEISNHFPGLADCELIILNNEKPNFMEDLPASDIAFATIWMSAYFLLKYKKTKHKYYFIQDYEPLFYEGGSMYALAESTYRFGFSGIVNTPGLLESLKQRHALKGVSFVPAVDSKYYYPPGVPKNNAKVRVFFYARPGNPRNAFELCILIIQELIKSHSQKVEIITAGANWDESHYGLKGKITNLGLLGDLEEVADLYRSCDVGCVYMLSKHPSYQPFEFMACSMATVSNRNEDNLWLLKDGENCLLAEPSPSAMAEKIGQLVDDQYLRHKVAEAGLKTISTDWQSQLDAVWDKVLGAKNN